MYCMAGGRFHGRWLRNVAANAKRGASGSGTVRTVRQRVALLVIVAVRTAWPLGFEASMDGLATGM